MATYTPEQRVRALDIYAEHGPAEAARQTGISAATIRSWAHRASLQVEGEGATARRSRLARATVAAQLTLAQRRARLADLLLAEAERCVLDANRYYPVHSWHNGELVTGRLVRPPALERQRLISAAGDAIEHAQLLAGEATSRPELLADREARLQAVARLRDEVGERRALLEARRADPMGEESGS